MKMYHLFWSPKWTGFSTYARNEYFTTLEAAEAQLRLRQQQDPAPDWYEITEFDPNTCLKFEQECQHIFDMWCESHGREHAYAELVAFLEELELDEDVWHAVATRCYHNTEVDEEIEE